MRDKKKLFDNEIKYSCVMPIHRVDRFTNIAIDSVVTAIGDRKDVEFIILDDSDSFVIHDASNFKHIKLPKIDLINKLIIGTQIAKGKYYCNVDYDDISHPKKFELFDKILKYNDIAGANQCVFWDVKSDKTYKLKNKFKVRTHKYCGRIIENPWLQHSNSATPLKWLRIVGYDDGRNMTMTRTDGKMLTDSPIWARAHLDELKFGFFDDIDKDAWKQCWQILTGENVNIYDTMDIFFDEVKVKKPKELR